MMGHDTLSPAIGFSTDAAMTSPPGTTVTVDAIMGAGSNLLGKSAWKPDLRDRVREKADHFVNLLRKLAETNDGQTRKRSTLVRRLLACRNARFCCLLLTAPPWPDDKALTIEQAELLAENLDPRKNCGEAVRFFYKTKPEGGKRPLLSFGPLRRAAQKLVLTILQAIWGPLKLDHAQRGLGRSVAVRRIIDVMEKEGGPRWFVTADVRNCFGSFNKEEILNIIPLPRSVIEHCLLISDDVNIIHNGTLDPAVRQGLPQGSLASSYIAGKLIEMSISTIDDAFVLSFADDIFVGAPSQEQAIATEQNLHELFQVHPAGPLLLKSQVACLGMPIDFLGYRFRRRKKFYGGGVYVTPSPKAFNRFEHRFVEKVADVVANAEMKKISDYTDAWIASFHHWEKSPNQLFMLEINIEAHYVDGARARRKILLSTGKHPSQKGV